MMGYIKCKTHHVKHGNKIYIGLGVHIVKGENMIINDGVQIRPECDLFANNSFKIGKNCDIGIRCRISGDVEIGDSVLMGPDNYICSLDHCYNDINTPIMNQGAYPPKNNGHNELKIGDGSWIGTHVAIIGDVHIGKNCVVGANSVVTKDIPDYCVAVGSPAKVIKAYDLKEKKWKDVKN